MDGLECYSGGLASFFSAQQVSSGDVDIHGLLMGGAAAAGHGDGDRKQRRLASNRESARRSRMRRRRQLDDLSARVAELRDANQRLVVELNRAEARHAQVARENARLREEARRLKATLGEEDERTSP